jgi:hypothetical protein
MTVLTGFTDFGEVCVLLVAVRAKRTTAGAVSPPSIATNTLAATSGSQRSLIRHREEHSDGAIRWAGRRLELRETQELDSVTGGEATRSPAQTLRCKDNIGGEGSQRPTARAGSAEKWGEKNSIRKPIVYK